MMVKRRSVDVRRELPGLRPVLVVDLVDEHLDLLGTNSVCVDERLSDSGDEAALGFEFTGRLLNGHDGHLQAPFDGWSAAAPA
jgi:hypothetical protein